MLGYDAGLIYQENAAGNWFSTTAAGWPTPVWTELGMAANPCTGTSTTGAGTATTAVGVATSSTGGHGASTGSSTTGHGASTSTGSSTSGSSGSGIVPPAQAAAAGFHTLVFNQGGDAGWNIDTNHTGDAGYAWYESGGFYGASDAVTSVSNGVLTLISNSMPSATRRVVDNDAGYVGYAFGDGFYVEAELAMDAGCVAGGSGVFSAFWGLPIEKELVLSVTDDWPGQVKDYEHYVELDFMEYWGNYTSFYTLDWWGVYQTTCPGSSYCDCGNNGGCSGVPDNGPDDVPTGTNFSDFNVYGALVVPSQANDGGTGYTQGYFNNQPTPSHDVWSAYDPSLGPPPTGKQIFAATDVGHYYLIANTVPGCAMQMQYVRVWQAP